MKMNRRETLLATLIAVSLGSWALLSWVIDPVIAAFDAVGEETVQLEQNLAAARALVDSESKILSRWYGYEKAGLSRTLEEADAETGRSIFLWAEAAGFKQINLSDGKAKADEKKPFGELSYTMQSSGKLDQIVDLLWSIRRSPFPLKIDKCVIDLRNDRNEDLQVSLTVSTLYSPGKEAR